LRATSKGLAQWRLHKGSGGKETSKFALSFMRATAAIAPNPSYAPAIHRSFSLIVTATFVIPLQIAEPR